MNKARTGNKVYMPFLRFYNNYMSDFKQRKDKQGSGGDFYATARKRVSVRFDVQDDESIELRVAFDFDGVVANDEAERVYKERGIKEYHEYENQHSSVPIVYFGLIVPLFSVKPCHYNS